MLKKSDKQSYVAAVTALLVALGTGPLAAAQITYGYERPAALGPLPQTVALALAATEGGVSQATAEEKARALAKVLDVSLDSDRLERGRDGTGEVAHLRSGRHLFTVLLPSGMARYRDLGRHNRTLATDSPAPALAPEKAMGMARSLIGRLARAGLVSSDELQLELARVSHRKGATDAGPTSRGEPQVLDTRVFVPRVIDGLGVSGHGVQFTFANNGELTAVDLRWRELRGAQERRSLAVTLEAARERFEGALEVSVDSRVEVTVSDLVYYDPSPRDPVAFLEPAYLFVYRVLTPIEDSEEFIVSKLLHEVIPAVQHDLRQIASPRQERLQIIDPLIKSRRPQRDDDADTAE